VATSRTVVSAAWSDIAPFTLLISSMPDLKKLVTFDIVLGAVYATVAAFEVCVQYASPSWTSIMTVLLDVRSRRCDHCKL
jgi:hypothetical protein